MLYCVTPTVMFYLAYSTFWRSISHIFWHFIWHILWQVVTSNAWKNEINASQLARTFSSKRLWFSSTGFTRHCLQMPFHILQRFQSGAVTFCMDSQGALFGISEGQAFHLPQVCLGDWAFGVRAGDGIELRMRFRFWVKLHMGLLRFLRLFWNHFLTT